MKTLGKRTNEIYGNCQVFSIKGNLMFLCIEKRANWYLERGLAEKLSENPLAIKLLFETKNEGNHGDSYYLTEKQNRCVKCGTEDLEHLTKHHIVPYQYRKFMPEEVKGNSSFDIVPICFDHHNEYERQADLLKQELAEKYDAPVVGIVIIDEIFSVAISAAKAIRGNGNKIPTEKRTLMEDRIKAYTGKDIVSKKDIELLCSKKNAVSRTVKSHAEMVMSQVTDIQSFVEMWREHFLECLEPEFMPNHWDPKRSIYRKK